MSTMTKLLVMATLVVPAAADETPKNPLAAMIERLELGEPMQGGQLILIPLVDPQAGDGPGVTTDRTSTKTEYREASFPARRFNVDVKNPNGKPLLLFGGSVLVGGRLDRMNPVDVLIQPLDETEVYMIPAEYMRRERDKPAPFSVHGTLAPAYLRERAASNPHHNLVPTFVSHFLEFRPEKDDRLSLAAIDEAPTLAKFCVSCHAGLAEFPDIGEKKIVGFITSVRGRLQSVEIFGSNRLLRTYFEGLVRANAYAAAAIELRARRVGIDVPETPAEALKDAKKQSAEMLERLKKARFRVSKPDDGIGERLLVRTGNVTGSGIALGGEVVHAAIFPVDPFERRLYGKPIIPPNDDAEDAPGSVAELERRAGNGARLTEYEKRILERMRRNRQPAERDG